MTIRTGIQANKDKLDAMLAALNGGTIEVRTGAQPATPATAASGTLLATLTFGSPAFGAAATSGNDMSVVAVAAGGIAVASMETSAPATQGGGGAARVWSRRRLIVERAPLKKEQPAPQPAPAEVTVIAIAAAGYAEAKFEALGVHQASIGGVARPGTAAVTAEAYESEDEMLAGVLMFEVLDAAA